MQVIEKSHDKIVLRMPANESLANALRRAVLEVPVLAVDEVEIFKNDSALYDEVLAHRIGLIPIKTEKSINSKTSIALKLSKTGPCTVYAEDFKGPVEFPFPKIPLTILNKNHQLELSATATLGTATDHAKYVPGLCYYRHLLEIKSSPEFDKLIQNSKSSFKAEKKGSKWLCDPSDAAVTQIEEKDSEAIKDSDEILFIIESHGFLKAEDIYKGAIKALESDLDGFVKLIK